jgi:hypothetical protein
VHVLTAADDEASLTADERYRLAGTLFSIVDEMVTAMRVADRDPESAAPDIDGQDDFVTAPFHVWHPVKLRRVGWAFEWAMPLVDLSARPIKGDPPFALGALAVEGVGGPLEWAWDDLRDDELQRPDIVEHLDHVGVVTTDFEIRVLDRSIEIDVACARSLIDDPSRSREQAAALLDCAEVDELFADDATLGSLAAAW